MTVTINSDDPSYFGGYINENYLQMAKAQNLTRNEIYKLAENSFMASFITESERTLFLDRLKEFDEEFEWE